MFRLMVFALGCAAALSAQDWDFVPGERMLLFDDFTDMAKGAAPPHWRVRGASVTLEAPGRLRAGEDTRLTPNVAQWPANFTLEQEFIIDKTDEGVMRWEFGPAEGEPEVVVQLVFYPENRHAAVMLKAGGEVAGEAEGLWKDGASNTLQLWMQDGRMRVYFNGARLIDVNQVKLDPPKFSQLEMRPGEGATYTLLRVRIAESAPDFSQTLLSSGRFVTHGIHFDVNSDRLREESVPVLAMVARALAAEPSLRLRIEGHTDSSGDPAKNLDLSRRRAEAVRQALISRFAIAGDRLTSEGLGQTKPAAPNDTPRGRAENRRVEFVKI
jgi:outer membrane protein OmpA-like peptidoglycan-associated protein